LLCAVHTRNTLASQAAAALAAQQAEVERQRTELREGMAALLQLKAEAAAESQRRAAEAAAAAARAAAAEEAAEAARHAAVVAEGARLLSGEDSDSDTNSNSNTTATVSKTVVRKRSSGASSASSKSSSRRQLLRSSGGSGSAVANSGDTDGLDGDNSGGDAPAEQRRPSHIRHEVEATVAALTEARLSELQAAVAEMREKQRTYDAATTAAATTAAAVSAGGSGSGSTALVLASAGALVPAPAGQWVEFWDESAGASYYFNTTTQEVRLFVLHYCYSIRCLHVLCDSVLTRRQSNRPLLL
jgi:hypothetical protein